MPPRVLDAVLCLALVAAALVLHGNVLGLGWAFDDPYILECAIFENPLGFFWDPDVYRRLSTTNFTPMVIASYAFDHALLGLWPAGFYAHQLLALGGVAVGIYALVAPRGRAAAILAAGLFLVSGPATVAARVLMFRHYLEGACFALLAVLLLRGATRLGARAWLAGVAYACAGLCKEVYLPLIAVLPFVGRWPLRDAIRICVPAGLAAAAYVLLRLYMLPSVSGFREVASDDLADAGRWWDGLTGAAAMLCGRPDGLAPWLLAGLAAWLVAVVAVAVRARAWRGLGLAAACTALAFGTVVPLWFQLAPSMFHGYRLVIHVAVLAAVGLGLSLPSNTEARGGSLTAHAVVAALLGVFMLFGIGTLSERHADAHRLRAQEMEFLWREPADRVLVSLEKVDYWPSIRRLRKELLGQETASVCNAFFDLRGVDARYVAWGGEEFGDWTRVFVTGREHLMQSRDDTIPFSVDIDVVNGRMRFELDGGEPQARYFFLRGGEPGIYQRYESPPRGEVGFYITRDPHHVRVMKVREDASFALSPEWVIDLEQDRQIRWLGGG